MKRLGIWAGPVSEVTDPIVSTDGRVGFVNANAAGIFIPLGLTLNPMFGAAAMSLSSFCVVSNALRLNLIRIRGLS